MKQLKRYLIVLFVLIAACKTVTFTIIKSNKRIHYPGIKSGTSFIKYQVEFKNEEEFFIERVQLNDEKINDYELYNVDLERSVNKRKLHKNGTYNIMFKILDLKKIDATDVVSVILKGDSETKKWNVNIKKIKPFRRR